MIGGAFIARAPVPVGAGTGPLGCAGSRGFGFIVLVGGTGGVVQDVV